jgi:hypothetical protein
VVGSTPWRARRSNIGSVVCLATLPGIAPLLGTVPSTGWTAPHRSAPLNMLSVQAASQEPHTLIAALQNQVSLQHQLLAAQATLARQDELLSRT